LAERSDAILGFCTGNVERGAKIKLSVVGPWRCWSRTVA